MAEQTIFWYDLETSGFDKTQGIMQLAGMRTPVDDLSTVLQTENHLIKMNPDYFPSVEAVLLTGITPQKTLEEGVTEAEFLEIFHDRIATPGTIFAGFNTVRFDDEFLRHINFRNFHDPYKWAYEDGRSRWDILDMVRMARALRPDDIKWPMTEDKQGNPKATNRLEELARANGLLHDKAHDALSDVEATIAMASLVRTKQPRLFDYLLNMRSKHEVAKLVNTGEPFVYTSGKYPGEFSNTTIAVKLGDSNDKNSILVYDLRFDPEPFLDQTPEELAEAWQWTDDPEAIRLPVKTLKMNRCPAVADVRVVTDEATEERIGVSRQQAKENMAKLGPRAQEFADKLKAAAKIMDKRRDDKRETGESLPRSVDNNLYDGFISDADGALLPLIRKNPDRAMEIGQQLQDKRLKRLLPIYVARNYPKLRTPEISEQYEAYRREYLLGGGENSRAQQHFKRLAEMAQTPLDADKKFLLEELTLYGQSIWPETEDADEVG